MLPLPIAVWHECVAKNDLTSFLELVADDAVFQSPAIHTPQVGKAKVEMYLRGAFAVLNTPGFRYVDEWIKPGSAILEFEGNIGGMALNGIDLMRWNDEERVTGFKVMVRPFKGLTALMGEMQKLLETQAK